MLMFTRSIDEGGARLQLARTRALEPIGWARDLSALGVAAALVATLVAGASATFVVATTLTAAALGAGLGSLAPLLLHRRVRRVRVVLLLGASTGIGAAWGGLSALVGALLSGAEAIHAVTTGAQVGLLLLSATWLPLLLARVHRRVAEQ